MRSDSEKLKDILEAIIRIEKYSVQGKTCFEEDELIQTWFVQNLQIIGEASRSLSGDFREQHSEMPWSQMIGMRNILVHNYFEIDTEIVWSVIERNLPELKAQIETILRRIDN
ncbi:MAG: HepT-like ribonuclease domain-containing protein [Planktothrix sp.]